MMHKTSEAVCASMAPALATFADSIKSITADVRLDSIRAVLDSINSSGWLSSYRASEVEKVVSAQQELLAACMVSIQTPAIRDMVDRFASKDYFGVYESLANSLSGLTVRVPTSPPWQCRRACRFPRGFWLWRLDTAWCQDLRERTQQGLARAALR